MSTEAAERRAWHSRLQQARATTDEMFSWLKEPAWLCRPIAERHRLIFYLGHLEAFDWNLLCGRASGRASVHAHFEKLFAFGIDPVDGGLPTDVETDWPSRESIVEWIHVARRDVDSVVESAPLEGILKGGWAIQLAIEHREMHAETLAYLLARIPSEAKSLPAAPAAPPAPPVDERWCSVPAGLTTLGLDRSAAPFEGWDNEYPAHQCQVPAFRIASHKMTRKQWLEFIEAGGYQEPRWWSEAGYAWRLSSDISAPASWVRRGATYAYRGLSGEVPMNWDAPVYVSHAEAQAYARWRGCRLPTEAQWHRAVYGNSIGAETEFPWGNVAPKAGMQGNFGGAHFDPTPVGSFPAGRSAFGLDEPVGNGWEWTSTVFAPFVGFEALSFYPGYSRDFFDGKHWVMKGASPRTPVGLLRRSFRNWFQPHYPYVFATVRLVEGTA